jgi:hypothetical protein
MTIRLTFNRAMMMGKTTTLTSLAMLRVEINHGGDYLEYLTPFVKDALSKANQPKISDENTVTLLKENFGLAIPQKTIHIILKRLAKKGTLKREDGVYKIANNDDRLDLTTRKIVADRHITSVINGLIKYAEKLGIDPISHEKAVNAICTFLSEFNVDYLKAYLKGTAIPEINEQNPQDIILVSKYAFELKDNDPSRFQSFIILLQGHMLANALMCPDLHDAPKTFKGVSFYLDTPLLIQALGLEGSFRKQAVVELLTVLRDLGAKTLTFSHCREELDRVIHAAISFYDSPKYRGGIVREAKLANKDKSDLILAVANIDENLEAVKITVDATPKYINKYQIDEKTFEDYLGDEVSYYNDRAKEYDINSVRAIYVLREGKSSITLEKCTAAFITSNSGFAKAAFNYGKAHANHSQISSVITDFSLANIAWLKSPMGAANIPTTELLAFAYAAKQPTTEWLNKYLDEIEVLERSGNISTRDHQLLRSSSAAQECMMDLTLGEDQALTSETINETLRRITAEITFEENVKLEQEMKAKEETKNLLDSTLYKNNQIKQKIYWSCDKNAKHIAIAIYWVISIIIVLLAFIVLSNLPDTSLLKKYANIISTIIGTVTLILNISLPQITEKIEEKIRVYLLKGKSEILKLLE